MSAVSLTKESSLRAQLFCALTLHSRAQSLQGHDAEIPEQPLLHPIDEELLEEQEVREGSVIERTERVQCTVALAKVRGAGMLTFPMYRSLRGQRADQGSRARVRTRLDGLRLQSRSVVALNHGQ